MLALSVQLVAQASGGVEDHAASQYKLVDIGTLGGPRSYINPANDLGSSNQVNARGIAVGGADLPIPGAEKSVRCCFGTVQPAVPTRSSIYASVRPLVPSL